jgi:uncharacterized protein involved in type VI secretion and phage assembly
MLMENTPRETTLEAGGFVKGVAVALVRQNRDPDGLGRVKVSYPWHNQPRDSFWARIAVAMAGNNRGNYFLPEVDDEVLVAFERGDLRFPYVIGALWNGQDRPPANNDDGNNDVRLIRTRKGHILTFDDGEHGMVQLELNDGKKLRIDDDGIALDDTQGNSLLIQTSSQAVTIEARGTLTLKAARMSIEATGTLDIKSNATLSVTGTLVQIN